MVNYDNVKSTYNTAVPAPNIKKPSNAPVRAGLSKPQQLSHDSQLFRGRGQVGQTNPAKRRRHKRYQSVHHGGGNATNSAHHG